MCLYLHRILREAAKKVLFLVRGGGKGRATKEKRSLKQMLFFFPKVSTAIKPREGGGKGFSGWATKKRTFFAASLIVHGNNGSFIMHRNFDISYVTSIHHTCNIHKTTHKKFILAYMHPLLFYVEQNTTRSETAKLSNSSNLRNVSYKSYITFLCTIVPLSLSLKKQQQKSGKPVKLLRAYILRQRATPTPGPGNLQTSRICLTNPKILGLKKSFLFKKITLGSLCRKAQRKTLDP